MDSSGFSTIYRRYRDVFVGAVMLIVFLGVTIASYHIRTVITMSVDGTFWPKVIGYTGMLLSLVVILQGCRKGKILAELEKSGEVDVPEKEGAWYKGGNLRALLTLLLIFFYIFFMNYLGWPISTCFYLFFQIWILTDKKNRSPLRIAVISVVFTVIVYLVFRYLFVLILPRGSLWSIFGLR